MNGEFSAFLAGLDEQGDALGHFRLLALEMAVDAVDRLAQLPI
jgi:hypothetical protein